MAKQRGQKLKKPHSAPSPGRRRLKVFKTPIGFHDAYVAAPSRKAALAAWGAGTDLFSAGIAEEVKDGGEAAVAALAKPGDVVRAKRGGGKEVTADRPSSRRSTARGRGGKKARPSRAAVDKAEAALAALAEKQAAERAALAKEEERLTKKRQTLDAQQATALDVAEGKLAAAEEKYRRAMRAWEA